MTLQDFTGIIDNNLINFAQNTTPLLLPIFASLAILVLGLLSSFLLSQTFLQLSSFLTLEKYLSKNKAYDNLTKENNISLTNSLSQIIWWTTLLVFVFASFEVTGLTFGQKVLTSYTQFLPRLFEAALSLLVGGLLAYLTFVTSTAFGKFSKLPFANLLARALTIVVSVFAVLQTLKVLEVSDEIIRFLILGAVAALTISLSLSGKELFVTLFKKIKEL